MAVHKSVYPIPSHLDRIELVTREGVLVLLPDTLSEVNGQMVAGFRAGAQSLRVRAKQTGIPTEVLIPEGARAGHYAEHAADWVLPIILGVPATTVAQLIAGQVQLWLDDWRGQGRSRTPTLRYREIVVDEATQQPTVRELEGPADEVVDWIIRRSALEAGQESNEEEWQWPKSA